MNLKQRTCFSLTLFVILLLTSCIPVIPGSVGLAVTATPAVLADCFQTATALAWLDANGDGVWDDDEPPLAGIEFVLEPTVYSRTTSDENGIANIFATTPGDRCPELTQVIATNYAGYELTTPGAVGYISAEAQHLFGFQPIPDEPPDGMVESIVVETEAYTGVIFTSEATAMFIPWLDEPAHDMWMPNEADVMILEDGLAAFVQERELSDLWERLPSYTRQYFGIVQDGDYLILVNFFCDELGIAWQETAVIVDDGGECYFQTIYSVETNSFLSLKINGES